MTSTVRIVFTNGTSVKRKLVGQRLSWLIVRGKREKTYYPIDQVRTINYKRIEDYGFDSVISEWEGSS